MKKLLLLLAGGVALSVAGCGLDDYEKRMDIERKRVRLFDAEEAYLTGPLETPPDRKRVVDKVEKSDPAWPFPVYVRVPIGFERSSNASYAFNDVFIDRYLGNPEKPAQGQDPTEIILKPGSNLFVACSKVGEINKAKETFNPGELSQVEFRRRVLRALKEFFRKEYKADYDFAFKAPNSEIIQPEYVPERVKEPVPPMQFDSLTYSVPGASASTFYLYFYRNGVNQIALIYQVPESASKEPRFLKAMDYSLKTLDITDNAMEKKAVYLRSHRTVPKKT